MRAILSVSDKTGLIDFARGLSARGVQLVSTGGTSKALADAGLPVTNVSDVTGFPEMMDGRVKTLHPKIHGGILARRHRPDDLDAIKSQGVELVDLVVVNLYPFAKAAQNPETPFDELVEQIDIGGPSLLRAAGKNFRDVMVVVDPADYPKVLEQMARPGGPSLEFKFELMQKAFAHTAQFDALIAMTLQTITCNGETFSRLLPPKGGRHSADVRTLRYGENPHQKAHWTQGHGPNWRIRWETHQGKELSYTNLLDLDAAARIALEFTEPAAVVIKHTNPCGTATGTAIAEAYVRARDADPLSAFGGIVGLNREIDADTATALTATFIEAVIAPSFTEDAKAILTKKTNLRVVTADFAAMAEAPTVMGTGDQAMGTELRSFLGGMLHQEPDRVIEAREPWGPPSRPPSPHESSAASAGSTPAASTSGWEIRVVTKRQPTAEEWTALRFAWRVCAHVKSNTIVFTGADRTLAVGAGQMSRVDSVKVAVMKAAPGSLTGSVVASDAFFPFRDGLDAVADAGATAVVQPGGSVRDAEVIAAADERGLAMVFTGRRHFRH